MTFKIFSRTTRKHGKQWYFNGRGDNGEIILRSEGYQNRSDCRATVDLIKATAAGADIVIEGGTACQLG